MQKSARVRASTKRDSYFELVRRFPLRPLTSEAELDEAIAVVDRLIDRPKLDRGEQDYLDVLADLIERYEEKHHPIPPSSDADLLRSLLETRDLNQVDLARATGIAESTISAVLAGKRALTRLQIGKLAAFFHVEPGVFAFGG